MGAFDTLLSIVPRENCYRVLSKSPLINGDLAKQLINLRNRLRGEEEEILMSAKEFKSTFYKELELVIGNKNIVITDDDVHELISYLLNSNNIIDGVSDVEKSLIKADTNFAVKILNFLTTRCKIDKHDVNTLLNVMTKMTIGTSSFDKHLGLYDCLWIDNLIKSNTVLNKNDIKRISKLGYDKEIIGFLNTDNYQVPIDVNIFFKKHIVAEDFFDCLTDSKISKNLIKNILHVKYKITNENFKLFVDGFETYICDNFSRTYYSLDKNDTLIFEFAQTYLINLLMFLDECKFDFTVDHLAYIFFDDSMSSIHKYENDVSWKTYKSHLFFGTNMSLTESVVNFFTNKKINLDFDAVYKICLKLIYDSYLPSTQRYHNTYDDRHNINKYYYGFYKRLEVLLKHELIKKPIELTNKSLEDYTKKISLFPCHFINKYDYMEKFDLEEKYINKLEIRNYFNTLNNFETINFNIKTIKTIVAINDKYVIELLIQKHPNLLTKLENGLRFACVNMNEQLINFYLNNKFEPSQYNVLCLIKSALYSSKREFDQKIKTMVNILSKFSLLGFKMDEKVYKVLCMIKKLDETAFSESIKHLGSKMSEIKKSAKPTKNIEFSVVPRKKISSDFKNDAGIQYMFKIANLQTLISLCEESVKLMFEDQNSKYADVNTSCLKCCLEDNYYPNVFEYFAEELKYVPDEEAISKCPNNAVKEIMKLRNEYVSYTTDKTIITNILNTSNTLNTLNTSNQPTESDKSVESVESVEPVKLVEPAKLVESVDQQTVLIDQIKIKKTKATKNDKNNTDNTVDTNDEKLIKIVKVKKNKKSGTNIIDGGTIDNTVINNKTSNIPTDEFVDF